MLYFRQIVDRSDSCHCPGGVEYRCHGLRAEVLLIRLDDPVSLSAEGGSHREVWIEANSGGSR